MKQYSKTVEIRFLPNDKVTFPTYNDIKNFLTQTMMTRNGKYYFPNKGMNCPNNTLVLFQYEGKLIASAFFQECVKRKCFDEQGREYKGYFVFDMNSMIVFANSITSDDIRKIDDTFKGFSQAKRKTDISKLNDILYLIELNK